MRRALGITQEALAELLEISQSLYSKKENGIIEFKLLEAMRLAEFFGCTIEDIFFEYEVFVKNTNKS